MGHVLSRRSSVEAYDLAAESRRLAFDDVVIGRRRLNRATAQVSVSAGIDEEAARALRREWEAKLFPTTLPERPAVVPLGYPTHGPFVLTPRGTIFDAYLAVAQKLLDEHHPRFRKMLRDLEDADVLLRREIVTDDLLAQDPEGRVHTPPDLASLWDRALQARWPQSDGYRAFFSSSGAEAVEAALKIASLAAYRRFLERFGPELLERVASELGFSRAAFFDRDPALSDQPVYDNYPFCYLACEGAFHGRTLGALSLTWSKRAQRLGHPRLWQAFHLPYNAPASAFDGIIERRPLSEILARPGALRRLLFEERRLPIDLLAAFVAEPFQGEGGYVPGETAFFEAARKLCDEAQALLVADEVQSAGRTGRLLMMEHVGTRPDVVCMAKAMVIGVTMAPAQLADSFHTGWHSNTWGAGRVLDTNFAYTTLDALLSYREPAFDGLSYLENEEVKGDALAAGLGRLAQKYPRVVEGHRGKGLMRALLVRRRSEVVAEAWQQGLKLLPCGLPGEVAPIRLLMLADTLAREVDELLSALDATLSALS